VKLVADNSMSNSRDMMPAENSLRRTVARKLTDLLQAQGFREIATSLLEPYSTAQKCGEWFATRCCKFVAPSGDLYVLRPEMTAPIIRALSNRADLGEDVPRLFYLTNVFNLSGDGAGSVVEQWQVGAEVISSDPRPLAESITLSLDLLGTVGVDDYRITVGHTGLQMALMVALGLTDKDRAALESYLQQGLFVDAKSLLLTLAGDDDRRSLLSSLGPWLIPGFRGGLPASCSGQDQVGLARLKERLQHLAVEVKTRLSGSGVAREAGAVEVGSDLVSALERGMAELVAAIDSATRQMPPEAVLRVSLGLVRPQSYYQGLVWEIYTNDSGLALGGGGQYDALIRRFGRQWSGTGFALSFDRLVDLAGQGRAKDRSSPH